MMLAAHDQENLVHSHQTVAASKPLNQSSRAPKTPGNRYPKTPLKIPLQDENFQAGFAGKSVLGVKAKDGENIITGAKKVDKHTFVTPMAPRNRAPLGAKTTNAKAKNFQTPAGPAIEKEFEKTQARPTSARRPKPKVSHAETVKLNIHGDDADPLEEREVEYAPPKPKDLPYQSDDFPERILDSGLLKWPNMVRNWQKYGLNCLDERQIALQAQKLDDDRERVLKETDDKVLEALEEMNWTVGDVPETFPTKSPNKPGLAAKSSANNPLKNQQFPVSHGPGTIASRNAATALSVAPRSRVSEVRTQKPTSSVKAPVSLVRRDKRVVGHEPLDKLGMNHAAGAMASRSTIGYNKGRTASNMLTGARSGLARSTSNLSSGTDTTITPARLAEQQKEEENQRWSRLKLLGAFDGDDEDLEPCLKGGIPDCVRNMDEDEDEDFVLTMG